MTPAPPVRARPIQRPDTLAELLAVLTIVGTALWWMAPVLLAPGWPTNREALVNFDLIEGFRRAFAHGHWYPLWFPDFQNGWGSADPLFHNRLFPMLVALLALGLHIPVVTALKATTCLLLIAGGLGMRALLRVSGASEPWAVGGALLFLTSPFTLTNWLFSGGMADFAGLMLLPWLYAELCAFIQGDRHWITAAVLLVLLFHADATLCGFFVLGAIGFTLHSLFAPRRRIAWAGAQRDTARILAAAAIVFVGVAPHLLVATHMLRYFVAAGSTLRPERSLAVEAGGCTIVAALLVHLLLGAAPRWRSVWRIPLYPFVLVWSLVCLLLQLPAINPLFRAPSQLLAFLTVGLVFILIAGARSAAQGGRLQQLVSGGVVSGAIVLTILLSGSRREPSDQLSPANSQADLDKLHETSGFSRYALRGTDPDRPLPERPLIAAAGCASPVRVEQDFQDGALKLVANEPEECRISIRQLHTPLLLIEAQGAHVESQPPSLDIVVELDRGPSSVQVRPRTLGEMVRWSLGR